MADAQKLEAMHLDHFYRCHLDLKGIIRLSASLDVQMTAPTVALPFAPERQAYEYTAGCLQADDPDDNEALALVTTFIAHSQIRCLFEWDAALQKQEGLRLHVFLIPCDTLWIAMDGPMLEKARSRKFQSLLDRLYVERLEVEPEIKLEPDDAGMGLQPDQVVEAELIDKVQLQRTVQDAWLSVPAPEAQHAIPDEDMPELLRKVTVDVLKENKQVEGFKTKLKSHQVVGAFLCSS
jgi:hypothetical protein